MFDLHVLLADVEVPWRSGRSTWWRSVRSYEGGWTGVGYAGSPNAPGWTGRPRVAMSQAAQAAGLVRDAGQAALCDELIGAVVEQVRPARPNGHGAAWDALAARRAEIAGWVKDGKTIVKIEDLLARSGTRVPYRTLHRFAVAECGFRARGTTVRVLDGDPGVECQIDFAQMGFITDPETGRRRKVHALILTAVLSRHMFVHLSYGQTLADVIAGCEAAWSYFGGVFRVLIPDNLKPVVTDADPVNPRFSVGWLDYSQHAGFVTDPARVRSPQDKPRVERIVQYVRGNFFDGENFAALQDAQPAARRWCTDKAGMRMHGTIAARPLEVFNELEAAVLLPVPPTYDVPLFRSVKVHRDHHLLTELPTSFGHVTAGAADRGLTVPSRVRRCG